MSVEFHEPGTAPEPAPRPAGKPGVRYVSAPDGKRVGWKRLSYLEQMRLAEITPPTVVHNQWWNFLAMAAFSVVEIEGQAERKPASKRELDALISRLGDDALDAIIADVQSLSPPEDAEAEAPASEPSEVDRAVK